VAGHADLEADGAAAALGFDPPASGGLLAAVEPGTAGPPMVWLR
jgi:hypothetical protein